MKTMLALFVFLAFNAYASDVPSTPPSACYDGCNEIQEKLLLDFETKGVLPQMSPQLWSGACHHSGLYDPDHEHYAVVLLDQRQGKWNFSTIFAFFSPENEFRDWNLTTARTEMSPYWNDNGSVIVEDNTARVEIRDDEGYPVYVYWMRQDPETGDLLYITYAGHVTKSFCRLKPH